MKASVTAKLLLGVFIAVAVFVSSLRASLDEVLAALPPLKTISAAPVEPEQAAAAFAKPEARSPLRTFESIVASDILFALSQAVEQSFRPSGTVTLNPLRELPDLSEFAKPFSVAIVAAPSRLARGTLIFRFQVQNESGLVGEWSVPFTAQVYGEAWFARSPLRRGGIASASDFEIREVDLLSDPEAVPARNELISRHEYSRDITPGKPLLWADLVERSLVRKGDIVDVSAVQGMLAVSMRAVARQDGSDGDIILFRNIDSSREFPARVVAKGRAEIIF